MLVNFKKNRQKAIFLFVFFPIMMIAALAQADLQADEQATIKVFEEVSPSVVFIKNAALQWDLFSTNAYEIPQGAGSGFIWDKEGHIVTNFHVIYRADKIQVFLPDKNSYEAKVIGISPEYDLAVLKIEAPDSLLKPVSAGDSKTLKVGQKAISIGNPFGLDYSLTEGVVSALGRSIYSIGGRKIHDVIQTDAAINPGNSGGPLLDSAGKVIGVSTMIFSPSGASVGVGFAIPVNIVKRIVPQLIKFGGVKRVGLGVTLMPDSIREGLNIKGAMILEVQKASAADKAGLKGAKKDTLGRIFYGDIIIYVDDKAIADNEDLADYFDKKKAGDKVNIKFLRLGKEQKTTAVLQELKN